jgi:hypothetical protein
MWVVLLALMASLFLHAYNLCFVKYMGGVTSMPSFLKAVFYFIPFTIGYSSLFGFYYTYFSDKVSYSTLFILVVGVSVVSGYLFDYFVNGNKSFTLNEIVGAIFIIIGVSVSLKK